MPYCSSTSGLQVQVNASGSVSRFDNSQSYKVYFVFLVQPKSI